MIRFLLLGIMTSLAYTGRCAQRHLQETRPRLLLRDTHDNEVEGRLMVCGVPAGRPKNDGIPPSGPRYRPSPPFHQAWSARRQRFSKSARWILEALQMIFP